LPEAGGGDFHPPAVFRSGVRQFAPQFTRNTDEEAVAKIRLDGLSSLGGAQEVYANTILAGVRRDAQFLRSDAKGNLIAFEAAAQMGAIDFIVMAHGQKAQAAGLAGGIESQDFGVEDVETAQEPGHGRGAGIAAEFGGRAAMHDAAGVVDED